MPDNALPNSIADMPVQYAANPGTEAEVRARYFNTGNAFNIQCQRFQTLFLRKNRGWRSPKRQKRV